MVFQPHYARNLLSLLLLKRLRDEVEETMLALSLDKGPKDLQPNFVMQGGYPMPMTGVYGEVLDALLHHAQAIAPRVNARAEKCSVRLQTPEASEKALPWHQDGQPMAMRLKKHGLVAWLPLDDIDGTRPSLELGPIVHNVLEHRSNQKLFAQAQTTPPKEECAALEPMKVGDVLWFSPYQLHRTHITPEMTKPRLSIDVRFREGW